MNRQASYWLIFALCSISTVLLVVGDSPSVVVALSGANCGMWFCIADRGRGADQ